MSVLPIGTEKMDDLTDSPRISPARLCEAVRAVIDQSGDASWKLDNVVPTIANLLEVDVCSVYRYRPPRGDLYLAATVGLRQSCVGNLSMSLNEGLVGLTGQQLCAVMVADASHHPRFKYFPDADEDRYHAFLGVPIHNAGSLLGVLVVQSLDVREYTAAEVQALSAVAPMLMSLVTRTLPR